MNDLIFLLFKTNFLHRELSYIFTKLFHGIFTTVNTMLIFMLINDDLIELETPDGILSPTLVVDDLSRLFLHPSIFSIKDSRSA